MSVRVVAGSVEVVSELLMIFNIPISTNECICRIFSSGRVVLKIDGVVIVAVTSAQIFTQ